MLVGSSSGAIVPHTRGLRAARPHGCTARSRAAIPSTCFVYPATAMRTAMRTAAIQRDPPLCAPAIPSTCFVYSATAMRTAMRTAVIQCEPPLCVPAIPSICFVYPATAMRTAMRIVSFTLRLRCEPRCELPLFDANCRSKRLRRSIPHLRSLPYVLFTLRLRCEPRCELFRLPCDCDADRDANCRANCRSAPRTARSLPSRCFVYPATAMRTAMRIVSFTLRQSAMRAAMRITVIRCELPFKTVAPLDSVTARSETFDSVAFHCGFGSRPRTRPR